MQNKNFLKQNLLITLTVILCWLIGYFFNFYRYAFIWMTSLLFLIAYVQTAFIQYRRIATGNDISKLSRVIKTVVLIFIIIFLLPLAQDMFWGLQSYFSYRNTLSQKAIHILNFGGYDIKAILSFLFYALPYLAVTGLMYWSVRDSKQIKEM